jgi:hypothetical protein
MPNPAKHERDYQARSASSVPTAKHVVVRPYVDSGEQIVSILSQDDPITMHGVDDEISLFPL